MCSYSHSCIAPPAFAAHTPLLHARPTEHLHSLSSRRPHTRPSDPRRRQRPQPVTAVFIWSNDYEDDSSEDPEDLDTEPTDPDQSFDDHVWPDAWRRQRSGDISSIGNDGLGARPFGPSSPPPDDPVLAAAHRHPSNPLFAALRQHTSGPDDIERLRSMCSESASDAFRRIVIGILGTIPTDTYEVVISTDRAGVSRLMQSSLSTGYALRNAEFRMLLNECMASSGSRENSCYGEGGGEAGTLHDLFTSEPDYMKNVPRRGKVDGRGLDGVVRWWDNEREAKQEMAGADYVAKLEAENELLRERLAATQLHDANNNKLMDFMRTLNPEKIAALQADLSGDAVDSFKRVVKSVLGELSSAKVQMTYSTSRDYIAQLTFWCLLVGYCIRNMEKQVEMTKLFKETEAFAEPSLKDVE